MGVEKVFMGFIWKEKGWSGCREKVQKRTSDGNFIVTFRFPRSLNFLII